MICRILLVPRLVDVDVEDGVGATRGVIHCLACHLSMHQTRIHDVHCLLDRLHGHFHEVAYENFSLLLPNLHILRLWVQEVRHLLKVNLKERDVNFPVLYQSFVL